MNSICIVGRLTRDPELRVTQAGGGVCRFCVAVNKRTKDGENAADFLDCVAFGKTAEFVEKWFHKGKPIGVEGALHSHTWEGDDGKKHKTVEISARQVSFVDSKNESGGGDNMGAAPGSTRAAARPVIDTFEAVEDDVPF